jgi:hypothetical protein
MAIDKFKEVVDRRGYLVAKEDRQIFEKEIKKSYFGLGNSDMIEFVLYDSNDNQLPQGDDAKLVRYIHISDSNFSEYFIKSDDSPNRQQINEAPEFLIDLEKLINDAGYSNGIFKTQVTLLNRRIGSEEVLSDKLWIHEISPSRTEIRLLPIKNQSPKDLIKRYNLFTEDGNFRDDTIYYASRFIEGIDVQRLLEDFLKLKGTIASGIGYKKLVEKEFGIDFEQLLQNIRKEFINSMRYFISDREWDVRKSTYGNPLSKEIVELSVSLIIKTAESCFLNSVNKYLPTRDIQEENELSKEQQVSLDRVKSILKSASSNQPIKSTVPDEIVGIVRGCTDKNAMNYNPMAKENDGSCKYSGQIVEAIVVEGCTDASALNYNKYATKSDGSCKYKSKVIPDPIEIDSVEDIIPPPPPPVQEVNETWYVWSKTGGISYKDINDRNLQAKGKEYDKFEISRAKNAEPILTGDVRKVPKIKVIPPKVYSYMVENCSTTTSGGKRYFPKPTLKEPYFRGNGKNRQEFYEQDMVDDFEYIAEIKGSTLSFTYNDAVGNVKTSSNLRPKERVLVCAQEGTVSNLPGLKIQKLGNCGETTLPPLPKPPAKVRGCTDPLAINYNSSATLDNNTCKYKIVPILPIEPIFIPNPKPIPIPPSEPIETPFVDFVIPDIIIPEPPTPTPPRPTPPIVSSGGGGGGYSEYFGDAIGIGIGGEMNNPFTRTQSVLTEDMGIFSRRRFN